MNIIHTSSLAYSAVGYNKPHDASSRNGNNANQDTPGNLQLTNGNNQYLQPSTTQQIATAISQYEFSDNPNNQTYNSYNQKALHAYNQNQTQVVHTQIKQSITGIDVYV